MDYIIDSHAWIEYFIGSEPGETLKNLFLNERNQFHIVDCCLAEIKGWTLKHNRNFDHLFKIIRANSTIIHVTEQNWIDAAQQRQVMRKSRKNFGLIDAVIIVKQKELNCKVISGDTHFKNLKNVIFLD